MSAARILIAEDESLIAEELRDRLERMGFTVMAVVSSAEDAITCAEEGFPDLLLMDVQLKGQVDGITAAAAIREHLDVPIVYLTALADDVTVERAKRTCPLGYLQKPVSERELNIAVKLALQYHHHGMQLRRNAAGDSQKQMEVMRAAAGASRQGFVLSHPASPAHIGSTASRLSQVKSTLPHEAIQLQLDKIVSSRTLAQSKRLVRFLSFIVEKGLKGEDGELNEYLIGVEVYERPSSFDPQIDTIVRTEARRLRSKLKQYYQTEGINDLVLIEVPKGSYAPAFRERERGIVERSPGQQVAHYRLLEKLGEGGMGTIYLAEDTQLGRRVALKFIHRDRLKEPHAKERLFREARAAAAIDHPNVAAVYEVGEVENQPYIAMAYVEGQELANRISEGPMEIDEALDVGRQLAEGLQAAHRQGVIHCDLNPANVILSDDNRVRIVDFGVAKLSSANRLTNPGSHMGTAHYVSPEQMKGEAVDQRTDIWSLGVILYEMLTGNRPFEAEHREAVYYAIAEKAPEPISRGRPGITEELEWIVFKCLEKEPASRYQEVGTLKADLLAMQPQEWRASHRPLHVSASQGGDEKAAELQHTPSLTQIAEPVSRSGGQVPFLRRNAGRILGATLAVLLILGGSSLRLRTTKQPPPRNAPTTQATPIPRLVVLPFESRSAGEESQNLSYAISDSLISRLAKLRGVQVTSWTTVMRLTERKATLPEIAKVLNVQYALEGSLLRSGQQGRVTAQLIRVSDDTHVWSEEFDFPWKEILRVREKVSDSVVRQMQIQLRPDERELLARETSHDVNAYQSYAKARYSLVRFSNFRDPKYLQEAEKFYKLALEQEPRFADALADLAYLSYQRIYPPQGNARELATQGVGYGERALDVDPDNVVALYALGSLYDQLGQAEKGLEFSRRAVDAAPSNPEAHHHLAWRYLERGFYESGIAENDFAIRKDTLFMDPYYYNAIFLNRMSQFAITTATVDRLGSLEPTSRYPKALRGEIAFFQGDFVQAEKRWRELLEIEPKPSDRSSFTRVMLAAIAARRGQLEEGRQVLKEFDTASGRVSDFAIRLAALVGEKDLAIDLIRSSILHRNYRFLVSNTDLAALRDEPRFRELLSALYQKWQRDLADLGPTLPVLPPRLPTPEEYLSRPER